MNLVELDRALRNLRLSGMADVLDRVVGPPRRLPRDVFKLGAVTGGDVRSCLGDTTQEVRMMLKTVLEPGLL